MFDGGIRNITNFRADNPIQYRQSSETIVMDEKYCLLKYINCIAGMILVSDAVAAAGLKPGTYTIGQQSIDVKNGGAYVSGTNTLAGR